MPCIRFWPIVHCATIICVSHLHIRSKRSLSIGFCRIQSRALLLLNLLNRILSYTLYIIQWLCKTRCAQLIGKLLAHTRRESGRGAFALSCHSKASHAAVAAIGDHWMVPDLLEHSNLELLEFNSLNSLRVFQLNAIPQRLHDDEHNTYRSSSSTGKPFKGNEEQLRAKFNLVNWLHTVRSPITNANQGT